MKSSAAAEIAHSEPALDPVLLDLRAASPVNNQLEYLKFYAFEVFKNLDILHLSKKYP